MHTRAISAVMSISNEMGVWDIQCECQRPKINPGEINYKEHISYTNKIDWFPLEIKLFDLTPEQESHIGELAQLYIDTMVTGRNNFAFGVKKEIEIRMPEEVWYLKGCYFLSLENNIATVQFDSAVLRY